MTDYAYEAAVRQLRDEQEAKELVDRLGRFVNGMSREKADAFATAIANEHPTLLGQIAKFVAVGVMRRATYTDWNPYDRYERSCQEGFPSPTGERVRHADHDGRLSCETVIGAEQMAKQFYL
jgi:hypothetical protein